MKLQLSHLAAAPVRAIDVLAQLAPTLSKQQLKQAMHKGAVWLKAADRKAQRRLRRVTHTLKPGDTLALYYDDALLARSVPSATLLADEQEYSVWDKPAGMLAQGTLYGDHCSLLFYAEQHFKPHRPCFLVHRLDSAASGLMLIAHTPRAAARLSLLFQQRQLIKRYRVHVQGHLDKGLHQIREPLDGKEAITHLENIKHLPDGSSDLLVRIESGRKHQIRRHLAMQGHPVLGDPAYGGSAHPQGLQLRATELSFTCPLNKQSRCYLLE